MVPAQTAPLLSMFQYGAAASLVSGSGRRFLGSALTNRTPFRTTNSRAGCGKSLPEMPARSEPSRKNMGRTAEGIHPCDQLGSPSNNVFGQEFYRTTRSKLLRQIPQGC